MKRIDTPEWITDDGEVFKRKQDATLHEACVELVEYIEEITFELEPMVKGEVIATIKRNPALIRDKAVRVHRLAKLAEVKVTDE